MPSRLALELPSQLLLTTHRERYRTSHPPHLLRHARVWLYLRLPLHPGDKGPQSGGGRRDVPVRSEAMELVQMASEREAYPRQRHDYDGGAGGEGEGRRRGCVILLARCCAILVVVGFIHISRPLYHLLRPFTPPPASRRTSCCITSNRTNGWIGMYQKNKYLSVPQF